MDIQTISMSRPEARERFLEYRAAVKAAKKPTQQARADEILMKGYRKIARGAQVIDLHSVLRQAGMDIHQRPRLAICRADARMCDFHGMGDTAVFAQSGYLFDGRAKRRQIRIPEGVYPYIRSLVSISAIVPSVPPRFRPKGALERYHLLWEPDWDAAPSDPILLRHIAGSLWAVLAQWDLTPLEQAVLNGELGN